MGIFSDVEARNSIFYRLLYCLELIVGEIAYIVTTITVLPLVRFYTEYLGLWYARIWWTWPFPLCVDGFHPRHNVEVTFGLKYGNGVNETMDVAFPANTGGVKGKGPVVVYLHGGGFVAVTSEVLMHSLATPLARSGFRVFSLNYPLAPQHPFPAAVVSTLKALSVIRNLTGCESVALIGDSAGGGIVAVVAALLANTKASSDGKVMRPLLKQLSTHTCEQILEWEYPSISHMISCYGVIDSDLNEKGIVLNGPFQDWAGEVVLAFCIRCYSPKNRYLQVADPSTGRLRWKTLADIHRWYFNNPTGNIFGDKLVLAHFDDTDLTNYPPAMFICGSSDPLIFGAQRMHRRFTAMGKTTELRIYPGHHAYLGFPVQWVGNLWRKNAWPSYCDIVRFLTGSEENMAKAANWPRKVPFDWTVSIFILLCLALPFVAFRVVMFLLEHVQIVW